MFLSFLFFFLIIFDRNVSTLSSDLPVVFADIQASSASSATSDSLYAPPPLHGGGSVSVPPPSYKSD